MTAFASIAVDLRMKTKSFETDLGRADRIARKKAQAIERSMKRAASSFAIGFGGAALGIATFSRALSSAVTVTKEFQTSMAEIATLLDDKSGMAKITKETRELAKAFGTSHLIQAKARYQAISGGVADLRKQTELLTAANKLAVGGLATVEESTRGLLAVMNSYGDVVGNAMDVADAFFVTMKKGITTIPEIVQSIGGVAGIAAQTGVAFEDLMAIFGAGTRVSKSAANTMDALRGVLAAIAKASSQSAEEMARLNAQMGTDIEFSITGMQDAGGLFAFASQIKEVTKGSQASISKLFGRVEAMNLIFQIMGEGFTDVKDILRELERRLGATDEAFSTIMDTPQKKIDVFKATIADLGIDLASGFVNKFGNAAKWMAENIQLLVDGLQTLVVTIASVIAIQLVTTFAAWVMAAGGLTKAWTILTTAQGLSAAAMLNWQAVAIAAFIAVAFAWSQYKDQVNQNTFDLPDISKWGKQYQDLLKSSAGIINPLDAGPEVLDEMIQKLRTFQSLLFETQAGYEERIEKAGRTTLSGSWDLITSMFGSDKAMLAAEQTARWKDELEQVKIVIRQLSMDVQRLTTDQAKAYQEFERQASIAQNAYLDAGIAAEEASKGLLTELEKEEAAYLETKRLLEEKLKTAKELIRIQKQVGLETGNAPTGRIPTQEELDKIMELLARNEARMKEFRVTYVETLVESLRTPMEAAYAAFAKLDKALTDHLATLKKGDKEYDDITEAIERNHKALWDNAAAIRLNGKELTAVEQAAKDVFDSLRTPLEKLRAEYVANRAALKLHQESLSKGTEEYDEYTDALRRNALAFVRQSKAIRDALTPLEEFNQKLEDQIKSAGGLWTAHEERISQLKREALEARNAAIAQGDYVKAMYDFAEAQRLINRLDASSGTLGFGYNNFEEIITEGFKAGFKGFAKEFKKVWTNQNAPAGSKANLIADAANYAGQMVSTFRAAIEAGKTFTRAATEVAAAIPIPWVAAIAGVALLIDDITKGSLLGTGENVERTVKQFGFDPEGDPFGGTITSKKKKRGWFDATPFEGNFLGFQKGGTSRWDEFEELSNEAKKSIRELFETISKAVGESARALNIDIPMIIGGAFQQEFDAQGNLVKEFSTVLGKIYNESFEEFGKRLVAENILAVLGQTVEQTVSTRDMTDQEIIDRSNFDRGDYRNGRRGERQANREIDSIIDFARRSGRDQITTVNNEITAIADRWRDDAEKLLEGANFLLVVVGDLQDGFNLLELGLTATTDIVEELSFAGENLTDTYLRLKADTALLEGALALMGISLSLSRENFVRFAADIEVAAGGLERATELWVSYFETFTTANQRAVADMAAAQTKQDELLGNLGIDASAFAATFIALLPTMTAEEIATWLKAGEAIGQVITLEEVLRRQREDLIDIMGEMGVFSDFRVGIIDLTRSIDDAIRSAIELGATEEQLAQIRAGGLAKIADMWSEFFASFLTGNQRAVANLAEAQAALDAAWTNLGPVHQRLDPEFFAVTFAALRPNMTDEEVDAWVAAGQAILDVAAAEAVLTQQRRELEDVFSEIGVFSDFQTALIDLDRNLTDALKAAKNLGASEKELELIRKYSERTLGRMVESLRASTAEMANALLESFSAEERAFLEEEAQTLNDLHAERMRAYEAEMAAVKKLKEFADSLLLNDALTPLTPREQLAEAQSQFSSTLRSARGGDIDAMQNLPGIASSFLDIARSFYASSTDYTDIFDQVQSGLRGVGVTSEMGELTTAIDLLRDTIEANTKIVSDFAQAMQIANMIENLVALASVSDMSVADIAAGFGLDLNDLIARLEEFGLQGFDPDLMLTRLPTDPLLREDFQFGVLDTVRSVDAVTAAVEAQTIVIEQNELAAIQRHEEIMHEERKRRDTLGWERNKVA